MNDKRKYISSTSEQDTSINTSVNSPVEEKKPKKKKGKGNVKKQKMTDESNADLKSLTKSIEEINKKLSNILTKEDKNFIQELLVDTLDQMTEKLLGSIINRVEHIEYEIQDKAAENSNLKNKINAMQVQTELLKKENEKLKQTQETQQSLREEKINNFEQCGLYNNVRITGVDDTGDETTHMTTKKVVTLINTKLPNKLSENEIDISYRVGKYDKNKKRHIIVKFVRRQIQNDLIKNSKMFKGTDIYVNEELTKLNRKVLMATRLKSKETIERAWSYQGKLFLKDKSGKIEEVKFKDFAFWLSMSWPEKETLTTEM